MKIERINENQIRCTLTKSDLEEHQMLLNELAFGGEHAKDLFREMMEQASDEVGFVADDIPLMIEAIPVSPEKLVLIVTKMDNPEDLDAKFSKYMNPLQAIDDLFTDHDENTESEEEDTSEVVEQDSKKPAEKEIFSPLGQILSQAKKLAEQHMNEKTAEKKETPQVETQKIYRFPSLLQTMDAAQKIASIYTGDNTLYKDTEETFYYLVLEMESQTPEVALRVNNILSEFGLCIPYNYAIQAYFDEHFIKMIPEQAISVLVSLS